MARIKPVIAFFVITALAAILSFNFVPVTVASYAAAQEQDLRSLQWWSEGIGDNTEILFPIAVIDSGFNPDVDPTGSLAANIIGGRNVVDDNDDYRDIDPITPNHGTLMAGIIASYLGVARKAPLLIVRAGVFSFGTVRFDPDDLAEGIRWSVDHGAQVINCSLGGGQLTDVVASAINYAEDHGVIMVLGAGNDSKNKDLEPDAWEQLPNANVIRVAASLANSSLAVNSAWGHRSVELAANVEGVLQAGSTPTSFVQAPPGSSAAAAIVSGVAGLLRNSLSGREVIARLCATVNRQDSLRGRLWTGGTLDPGRALKGEANPPLDIVSFKGKIKKKNKKLSVSGTEVLLDQQATKPVLRIWLQHSLVKFVEPEQDGSFSCNIKKRFRSGEEVRIQSSLGGEMTWVIP